MKLHYKIKDFNFKNPVVTIGAFDGVHLGHKKIIETVVAEAKAIGGESVIVSFFPHPRTVLNPHDKNIRLITSQKEKFILLQDLGVDHLVVLPFTPDFSQLPYNRFIEEYIVQCIHAHVLIIGYDHQFGKQREGDFANLKALASELHFHVKQIPALDVQDHAVSSTRIRKALFAGDMQLANKCLGHDYFIAGKVVKGNRIGNTIGFPTANINYDDDFKLLPANGVYAVMVKHKDQLYQGMLNIGIRPTIGTVNKTIEVHIFDFDQDIYKQEICVYFKARIRDEVKFSGLDALISQLNKDKEQCIQILKSV